jgi:hypothetical protein
LAPVLADLRTVPRLRASLERKRNRPGSGH